MIDLVEQGWLILRQDLKRRGRPPSGTQAACRSPQSVGPPSGRPAAPAAEHAAPHVGVAGRGPSRQKGRPHPRRLLRSGQGEQPPP
eukprot:scaffold4005_cov417-Prasinococcus_capsulatus_cf.AAC.4